VSLNKEHITLWLLRAVKKRSSDSENIMLLKIFCGI